VKVTILTEGGRDIGYGHITRCTSICQAFEEIGIQPQLIVNGDETIEDLLKGKNYKVFNWLDGQQLLFEILDNTNIVFVDSYLAEHGIYERISEQIATSVYFDDNLRIEYPQGFVVNGAVFAEQLSYPAKKNITYLLGTRYTPLRKAFWDVAARPTRDSLKTIMVTFGGTDICNLTPKVLKLLNDTYPKLLKKVTIGYGFENTTEIEKLNNTNTELIYCPDGSGMKNVMLESDIAISAGGQTLYELARIGVPTIAMCTADNQLNNIRGWEKTGFVEYVGWCEDEKLTDIILQKVELLKSKSIREDKGRIGNKLIDGTGSSEIVKELLTDVYKKQLVLRQAIFEDADDIFNLANDDAVRTNSFNPDKIEWEHHLEWLRGKFADSNCSFFIVECFGRFSGQVRFDKALRPEGMLISMSLDKSIRGLGLSSFIINKSITKMLEIRKNVKLIEAHIRVENTPSIKSFKRAGFDFSKNTIANGCNVLVYTREIGNFKHQRQVSRQ